MEEERKKIICDCGTKLKEGETEIDGVLTLAMVCPKCKFITLTKKQAIEFMRLKELHSIVDGERKIIKIGNSLGLTLPEAMGLKIGNKVKIKALSKHELKITF